MRDRENLADSLRKQAYALGISVALLVGSGWASNGVFKHLGKDYNLNASREISELSEREAEVIKRINKNYKNLALRGEK